MLTNMNISVFNEQVRTNYKKWIYDVARLITNDYETAIDIVDDVIVSLYCRLEKNDLEIKNLNGYIYKACLWCNNSATSSYQRHQGKDTFYVPVEKAFYLADDEPTEETEPNICFADVHNVLNESPFSWSEKEIYLRKHLEGKTTAKMAKEIGVTRGRIAYVCNKVSRYLKEKFNTNGKKKETAT